MRFKVIPWRDQYMAVFGNISEEKAHNWYSMIADNVPSVDENDMDEALATMASTWDFERQGKLPNVRDILKVIYNKKGLGKLNYKSEQDIIARGKTLLDACLRGDHEAMRDIICCQHQAWMMDRVDAMKMWTRNISVSLERYASRVLGYDPAGAQSDDHQSVISRAAKSMQMPEEVPF